MINCSKIVIRSYGAQWHMSLLPEHCKCVADGFCLYDTRHLQLSAPVYYAIVLIMIHTWGWSNTHEIKPWLSLLVYNIRLICQRDVGVASVALWRGWMANSWNLQQVFAACTPDLTHTVHSQLQAHSFCCRSFGVFHSWQGSLAQSGLFKSLTKDSEYGFCDIFFPVLCFYVWTCCGLFIPARW